MNQTVKIMIIVTVFLLRMNQTEKIMTIVTVFLLKMNQTEQIMIIVTVFLLRKNQTEFRSVNFKNENCNCDIPFSLKRNINLFICVYCTITEIYYCLLLMGTSH